MARSEYDTNVRAHAIREYALGLGVRVGARLQQGLEGDEVLAHAARVQRCLGVAIGGVERRTAPHEHLEQLLAMRLGVLGPLANKVMQRRVAIAVLHRDIDRLRREQRFDQVQVAFVGGRVQRRPAVRVLGKDVRDAWGVQVVSKLVASWRAHTTQNTHVPAFAIVAAKSSVDGES